VTRGKRARARPAREREQLGEAKASVAAHAWIRRLAAGVPADEGLDHRTAEPLAQIERHVWDAQAVTGLARGDHGLGRAARALRVRPLRIGPEAKRHSDRVRPCTEQRDGGVDPAAHRDRDAAGRARRPEDRAERIRERVDGERLAADGGRLQEGQAPKLGLEAVGVRVDDPVAVDTQPDERPAPAARRISAYLQHKISVPHLADASAP
jgi:hypothetical protein